MGDAFAWLGKIFEWLGQWIPQWIIVDPTMGGVKCVKGNKRIIPIVPGVCWYWPATTTVKLYPTVRQADNLRTQTICTKDDKVIAVGGIIIYEVIDVIALLTTNFEPIQTINELALSAIHDVCCQLTWEELKEQQRNGKLDRAMKSACFEALKPFGVRVLKTMLTDLSPVRVLKVIQSVSKDEE